MYTITRDGFAFLAMGFTGNAQRNFALSKYPDSTGRILPMYQMSRDGFTLLAMGFTGKKAAQFKEQYIDAFNGVLANGERRGGKGWTH